MRDLSRWAKTPAGTGGRFSVKQMRLVTAVGRGQDRRATVNAEIASELGLSVSEWLDIHDDSRSEDIEDALADVQKNAPKYLRWLDTGTPEQKKLVQLLLQRIPDGAVEDK